MQVIIPKITLDFFEIFGDDALEQELEEQEQATSKAWQNLYNNIDSGKNNIAYFDDYHSDSGFIRYALHRSPKKDGFLQLSVMEIRNGEIIPIRDAQYGTVNKFLQDMIGYDGTALTIK